jgi:hypothetical protein
LHDRRPGRALKKAVFPTSTPSHQHTGNNVAEATGSETNLLHPRESSAVAPDSSSAGSAAARRSWIELHLIIMLVQMQRVEIRNTTLILGAGGNLH